MFQLGIHGDLKSKVKRAGIKSNLDPKQRIWIRICIRKEHARTFGLCRAISIFGSKIAIVKKEW